MVIAAAAALPSAPVLIEGVGRGGGPALSRCTAEIHAVVASLPAIDVAVLVAAGQPALHDDITADLRGLGYPEVRAVMSACPPAVAALSKLTQYPRVRRSRLPLDLACLALLVAQRGPVVALEVSATAEFATLSAVGTAVVQALDDADLTGCVVVAADLSAALADHSPLAARPGAQRFDDQVVDVCASGQLDALAALGPREAGAFGARGWAPLCVLSGVVDSARLALSVRSYAAPRGVGYLVATAR